MKILVILLTLMGLIFFFATTVGLLRFPDFYSRMHAGGLTDTMGAGLILLGLALQSGLSLTTVKLVMILYILYVTSPTGTHTLAQSARTFGLEPLLEREEDEPSNS